MTKVAIFAPFSPPFLSKLPLFSHVDSTQTQIYQRTAIAVQFSLLLTPRSPFSAILTADQGPLRRRAKTCGDNTRS